MTRLINKIVLVNDRRTSMRLCLEEWDALYEICRIEKITKNNLIELIEAHKSETLGLTYSTRLFLVSYFREAASVLGHQSAGHGIGRARETITGILQRIMID